MDSAAPLQPQIIDLRSANSVGRLVKALGIPPELFQAARKQQSECPFYLIHRIPKKSPNRQGEHRLVWQALGELGRAHKTVARRLDGFFRSYLPNFPNDSAYGYVRGRSTRDNAKQHCGAKYLAKADIKDFFPSITSSRLTKIFLHCGIPEVSADALACFLTIDGKLPIGLHSSPMLANVVCLPLDKRLVDLSKAYECTYTRYADDISFSGNHSTPSKSEIATILADEGFSLSERKFRTIKRGQALYVTGLSVSDSTPHAPREMKRRLRQELYYASKYGLVSHLEHIDQELIQHGVNRIDGTVNYVAGIEKGDGEHYRHAWQSVLSYSGLQPTYMSRRSENRDIAIFVDEAEFSFDGNDYLALAFVRSEESERLAQVVNEITSDYLADPFSKGKKEAITRFGLHYTDAHPDLRTSFFNILPALPFSAIISFQKINDYEHYDQTYRDIFTRLLRQTYMTSDGASLKIAIDSNQKIKQRLLSENCEQLLQTLAASYARRPRKAPNLKFVRKPDEPCISAPDFLLAAFSAYAVANSRTTKDPHRFLEFERVRDKIRYIENGDTKTFSTRKRPFQPLRKAPSNLVL